LFSSDFCKLVRFFQIASTGYFLPRLSAHLFILTFPHNSGWCPEIRP
jgi:hypothetical protein